MSKELWANFVNPILALFGRKYIQSYIGFWHVRPDGKIGRNTYPCGWRLARRGEWEGMANGVTELDRFLHRINAEK